MTFSNRRDFQTLLITMGDRRKKFQKRRRGGVVNKCKTFINIIFYCSLGVLLVNVRCACTFTSVLFVNLAGNIEITVQFVCRAIYF